jgi:UDP-N-acetylmuramoyl-tripeptide--D-alanyl-D-alanine ligase
MINSTLTEVASWCGGVLHGDSRAVRAVSCDSRQLGADALFVAIRGERVDGHAYLAQAAAAGAAGALVEHGVDTSALAQIVVPDSTLALGQIAAYWLGQCPALRIGLTGSNGKTTVKTLLHCILAQLDGSAFATPGNRNNELGLPLAVLELTAQQRFAIFEMGAAKPGDIQYLCDIARPQISLVNNVAAAHLERLGSLDGVAQTKGAIYSTLPTDGIAVINFDDAYAPQFTQLAGTRRVIGFSLGTDNAATAAVRATDLRLASGSTHFTLWIDGQAHPAHIQLVGEHNVRNALAAAALALAAGANAAQILTGLATAIPVQGRLLPQFAAGVTILDDSYNANPGSFAAGLRTLSATAKRGWVVMGDMAELGPEAPELHAQIGTLAKQLGIERVYAVGPLSVHAVAAAGPIAQHFETIEALCQTLRGELQADVTLLVKGSRSSGMERVVQFLNAASLTTPGTLGVSAC